MASRNILLDAFYSLGRKINKVDGDQSKEIAEGVVGERLPELELDMTNEELVALSDTWEKSWNDSKVKSEWERKCDENENYWKGQHFDRPDVAKTRSIVDNAIFESVETYLPQITRRNPEPMVSLAVGVEPNDANQEFVAALQETLGEIADEQHLRLKLKGAGRHWALYLVGALKASWDLDKDMPLIKVIRPKKLILDPEATVDEDGYTGERIGEHRTMPAWKLVALIEKRSQGGDPDAVKYIKDACKEEMGTEMGFIEWWTKDYMCWKMGSRILVKRKNPHWNYDQEAPDTSVDDYGTETPTTKNVAGVNHFAVPQMPYMLLSIYNLGKQPVDETSLIGQNLSNQDLINKRIKQIDKNADSMNSGLVVSLERSGLTQQQAKGVTESLRKGGTVAIPAGAPQDAVMRLPTPGLPADVYNQLVDVRNRVRDIFGTRGSSPAGLDTETTVRGKIMNRTLDTDRIGGGISEYIEQLADAAYNWIVQLLFVYDDRFASAIAQGTPLPKIKVSVKEGSLLPKDSTTIANQALDLASGGKMSNIDLYKRLDYPNPEELAANAWLEVNAPELLYKDPRVQQAIQMRQQAAQAGAARPPAESISFKDLPPDGQAQMAAQAGIHLHPEAIAAHAEANKPPVPDLSGPGSMAALNQGVAPNQ